MTGWDLMLESIRRAMEALDAAHESSNELRKNSTPQTLDQFREAISELTKHLTDLQAVLDQREAFALDELADWLSLAFQGSPSEYRRTPRMKI